MATETLKIVLTADNKAALAGVAQVENSIDGLKESIKVYQDLAFNERDVTKLKAYNSELQKLQTQLKQTGSIGKAGFDDLGNAIKNTGNPLTQAFSGLRQIAYILPGIGIAGIFNLAFEAIGKVVDELGIFKDKVDITAKAQAEFNKEMTGQREHAAEDISHLKGLISAAQDASLSTTKRAIAVKELKKEYPDYFKGLTTENSLTIDLTKSTDLLTAAIYKRAEARAREADIAKKAGQVFENQLKLDKIDQDLAKVREDKAKGRTNVSGGGSLGGIGGGTDAGFDRTLSREAALLKEKDKLLTETSALTIEIGLSQQKVNILTAETIDLDDKETKVKKEKSGELKKEVEYWNALAKSMEKVAAQATTVMDSYVPNESAEARKKRLDFGAPEHLQQGTNIFAADEDRIATKRQQELTAYTEDLKTAGQYANYAAGAIGGLFDAMARGQNLGQSLGNVFKELAADIAKAAIKAAIFKIILSVLTSGGASIAGGAIGAAISGIQGAATGGSFKGPNEGFPVLLHGQESVLRPDQLGSVVEGAQMQGAQMAQGGNNFGGEFVIRGQDLVTSRTRAEYSLNLRR